MKRLFVTFALDAPLGTGDAELTLLVDKALEPLLALLERTPRIRAQLAISGIVFDFIFEHRAKLLPRIAKFFRDGALTPLLTAHYDPELSISSADELEAQLRLSLAAWTELGAPAPRAAWLPHGTNEGFLKALEQLECPLILLPSELLTTPKPLGEKHPLTRLHRAPHDLLLLPITTIHPSLGGAVRAREITSFFEEPTASDNDLLAPQITINPELLRFESTEPLHRSLERMFLRAGDDPQIAFEIAAELLKPFFPLSAAGASALPALTTTDFVPIPPLHDRVNTPRERRLLFHRLLQLGTEMETVPHFIAENANGFANRERFAKAERWLAKARSRTLFAESGSQTIDQFSLRKQIYRAILSAQVEIDTIQNPEVDPSIGWARYEAADYDLDGDVESIIDTQLVRLHFKPSQGGNLVAFDYKPRKANFVNHSDPQCTAECCTFSLLPVDIEGATTESLRSLLPALPRSHGRSTVTLTRKTLDMIGLRFATPIHAIDPEAPTKVGGYSAELVNHLLMKSEIGAHLSNATTGFSMEYWLDAEAAPADNLQLVQQWSMMLTSGDNRVLSVRPLLSAAGTHDRALGCEADLIIRPADAPGGLHGIRLIDGLDNLVMDLRSAKPVSAVAVLSITSPNSSGEPAYSGTTVLFFYQARRFFRDDKANTLFLSIK